MRRYKTFTIDTGTNFGKQDIFARSELHAFAIFVFINGSHFNETLTIEIKKPKLTDLSGFKNIFNY